MQPKDEGPALPRQTHNGRSDAKSCSESFRISELGCNCAARATLLRSVCWSYGGDDVGKRQAHCCKVESRSGPRNFSQPIGMPFASFVQIANGPTSQTLAMLPVCVEFGNSCRTEHIFRGAHDLSKIAFQTGISPDSAAGIFPPLENGAPEGIGPGSGSFSEVTNRCRE